MKRREFLLTASAAALAPPHQLGRPPNRADRRTRHGATIAIRRGKNPDARF